MEIKSVVRARRFPEDPCNRRDTQVGWLDKYAALKGVKQEEVKSAVSGEKADRVAPIQIRVGVGRWRKRENVLVIPITDKEWKLLGSGRVVLREMPTTTKKELFTRGRGRDGEDEMESESKSESKRPKQMKPKHKKPSPSRLIPAPPRRRGRPPCKWKADGHPPRPRWLGDIPELANVHGKVTTVAARSWLKEHEVDIALLDDFRGADERVRWGEVEIDHCVPKNQKGGNGGFDHPRNYALMTKEDNRALANTGAEFREHMLGRPTWRRVLEFDKWAKEMASATMDKWDWSSLLHKRG